jgi:hypothetical protein
MPPAILPPDVFARLFDAVSVSLDWLTPDAVSPITSPPLDSFFLMPKAFRPSISCHCPPDFFRPDTLLPDYIIAADAAAAAEFRRLPAPRDDFAADA